MSHMRLAQNASRASVARTNGATRLSLRRTEPAWLVNRENLVRPLSSDQWRTMVSPFFKMSLSSLRRRFSCRSRAVSRARSRPLSDPTSVSRCAVTHVFSVARPTPKSDATGFLLTPLVNAVPTASARTSSMRFSAIVNRPCRNKCSQRTRIKPRRVQP